MSCVRISSSDSRKKHHRSSHMVDEWVCSYLQFPFMKLTLFSLSYHNLESCQKLTSLIAGLQQPRVARVRRVPAVLCLHGKAPCGRDWTGPGLQAHRGIPCDFSRHSI